MLASPLASPADWTLAPESRTLPAGTRYAGRRLLGVRCTTGAARSVRAPMAAVVRAHEAGHLLEVEPAAFLAYEPLRLCALGLPEVYLWLDGATWAPPAEVLGDGAPLLAVADVWIGVTGQDGLLRDPRAWAPALGQAWQGGGHDVADWQAFEARLDAELPGGADTPVLLTDHTGAPLRDRRVRITLPDGAAAGVWEVELLAAHDGDLQAAVSAAGIGIGSVLSGGASQAEIEVLPPGGAGEPTEDQWAAYTGGLVASAGRAVVQADTRHFTHTDLHRWLAPQQVALPAGSPFGPNLRRLTRGNQVTPLLEGYETFAQLVEAIRAVQAGGGAVNMASWEFRHVFELVPRAERARFGLAEDDDLRLLALLEALSGAGQPARLLVNRFFQLEEDRPTVAAVIVVMLLTLVIALDVLRDSPAFESRMGREVGVGVGLGAVAGVIALVNWLVSDDLGVLERSGGARDALDALDTVRALWAPYPATKADNPLAGALTGSLADFAGIDHVGVYHQKFAVFEQGARLVGFAGGIDPNPDRLDDADHVVESPFHDAHVRVEGPAAEDLYHTFRSRWRHQTGDAAEMGDAPAQPAAGSHAVQVARTYFQPRSAARALPYAPAGDFTLRDTLLRAIGQAREFIYIEDQYFTPPADYRAALLGALGRIQKLIVVVPRTTDQPFGALHRQTFFDELVAAGGDRVVLASPVRRPHSAALPRVAAGGRFELREELPAVPGLDEEIALGPSARVPRSAPFWLCVEGELMYVDGNVALPFAASRDFAVDGDATSRFRVKRGGLLPGRVHAEPRHHPEGTPAMVVEMSGIYVHSKLMVVDDVFLAVGSANVNRRGLEHDGELHVFTVPEALRADRARNVARAFRLRLWADHLGLPPGVAAPLVADPIAGSRLFARPYLTGNRAVHPNFFELESTLDLTPGGSPLTAALLLFGVAVVAAEHDRFFDTIVDPTSVGP